MKTETVQKIVSVTILGLAVTTASLEPFIALQLQDWYALPSARIAGLFLGMAPVMTAQGEVFIPLANQLINITSKCSAFGFSCLLFAILIINVLKMKSNTKKLIGCVLALPLAYVITIIANGSRIVCGYYAHKVGQMILPDNFQSTIHMGVGIAVFLSTLIGITLIFERINDGERAGN